MIKLNTENAGQEKTESSGAEIVAVAEFASWFLFQLESFLARVPKDLYARIPVSPGSSSIGAHVRHALDYFDEFQRGISEGVLNYDLRERDRLTEQDPVVARLRCARGRMALAELSGSPRSSFLLSVRVATSPENPEICLASSAPRELYFVALHLIHHMATVATMARLAHFEMPEDFGKAPSTLLHERSATGS